MGRGSEICSNCCVNVNQIFNELLENDTSYIKNRITYIDQLKGIGIILVVIGHIMQFSFGFSHSSIVDTLSIFHMPLFFFISGYLAFKQYKKRVFSDLPIYLWKKTRVLIFPLFFWSMIWCSFENLGIVSFCKSGWGGYWFLWCLWISFCILILLEYISYKIGNRIFSEMLLFGFTYVSIVFLDYINFFESDLIPAHNLVTYLRYFFLGYFVHKYTKLKSCLLNKTMYGFGICFFIFQCYFVDLHNRILIFMSAIGAIIVLWFFCETNTTFWGSNLLAKVGKKTLPIYCIHYFFISDISNWIYPYLNVPNAFFIQFVCSIIYAITIIAACLAMEKIIRQNQILSYILLGEIKK